MSHKSSEQDIVWAKLNSYPWWPARRIRKPTQDDSIPEEAFYEHHKPDEKLVRFFGDNTYDYVDEKHILPFTDETLETYASVEYASKHVPKDERKMFVEAVKAAIDFYHEYCLNQLQHTTNSSVENSISSSSSKTKKKQSKSRVVEEDEFDKELDRDLDELRASQQQHRTDSPMMSPSSIHKRSRILIEDDDEDEDDNEPINKRKQHNPTIPRISKTSNNEISSNDSVASLSTKPAEANVHKITNKSTIQNPTMTKEVLSNKKRKLPKKFTVWTNEEQMYLELIARNSWEEWEQKHWKQLRHLVGMYQRQIRQEEYHSYGWTDLLNILHALLRIPEVHMNGNRVSLIRQWIEIFHQPLSKNSRIRTSTNTTTESTPPSILRKRQISSPTSLYSSRPS